VSGGLALGGVETSAVSTADFIRIISGDGVKGGEAAQLVGVSVLALGLRGAIVGAQQVVAWLQGGTLWFIHFLNILDLRKIFNTEIFFASFFDLGVQARDLLNDTAVVETTGFQIRNRNVLQHLRTISASVSFIAGISSNIGYGFLGEREIGVGLLRDLVRIEFFRNHGLIENIETDG